MCIQCGANDDSDACRECWGQHFGEPVVGYDDGGGGEFDRASINSLKERSGLTWSEFANLFSVSRRTVHAWNSGARMNSLHMERKQIITSFIDDTEPASPEEMRGVFLNLKDDGLTEYQKYVNNWNSAPIKTYERPLISNFTDPIYDDARTHEVVDSKEI